MDLCTYTIVNANVAQKPLVVYMMLLVKVYVQLYSLGLWRYASMAYFKPVVVFCIGADDKYYIATPELIFIIQ